MFKRRYLKISCLFFVSVIFLCSLIINPTISHASGTPSHLSYQGKLTDTGGNPLGGGGTLYYFKFSLWDSSTPGTGNQVWPATSPNSVPLTVKQGSFNVLIGDTDNGYPDTLDYDFNSNNPVYLQIEVSSDGDTYETLAPRSALSSTAFSKVSESVHGTSDSSFGTTTGFANTLVSMLSTAINKAVLTIKGAAGQVANLFNILDSNDNSLFTVTASGNVGVGTSTPGEKLVVNGNAFIGTGIARSSNVLKIQGSLSGNDSAPNFVTTGSVNNYAAQIINTSGGNYSGGLYIQTGTNVTYTPALSVNHGSLNRFTVLSSGEVGVGTSTPLEKLSITGGGNLGIFPTNGGGGINIYRRNNTVTKAFQVSIDSLDDTVLSTGNGTYHFQVSGSDKMTILNTGNIGIGTTTPSAKLDVNGNINIPTSSSTAGAIYQNGTRILHTYGTNNTFFGAGAGNFTTTGFSNVGIGTGALSSLGTNASFNFGLGNNAGSAITTGQSNVLIGNSVGTGITSGIGNTIVGDAAGLQNGNSSNSVFIGRGAGRQIGPFSNSVFIGWNAGGAADGGQQSSRTLSNAIAIGMNSFVEANNTMVLGGVGSNAVDIVSGTSTASAKLHLIKTTEQLRLGYDISNYLSTTVGSAGLTTFNAVGTSPAFNFTGGNVGVGVASPNEKLQVNGNIGTYGSGNGFVMYNLGQGNYSGNFEMARFMPVSNEFLFQTLQGGTGVGRNMRFAVGNAEMTLVNSSGNIGIGTTAPSARLHTISTTEQFRLGYDASNYWSNTVNSTGGLTMQGIGTGGSLTLSPTAGQNVNLSLSGTGDFAVNTNQFYVDTSTGNIGVGTASPSSVASRFIHIYDAGSAGYSFQNSVRQWSFFVQGGTGNYGLYNHSLGQYALMFDGSNRITTQLNSLLTTTQQKIGYDASNYYTTTVGSTGITTFNGVGSAPAFAFTGGNVGVGTNNPVSKFNVSSDGAFPQLVMSDNNYVGSGAHYFLQSSGGKMYIGGSAGSGGAYTSLADRITLDSVGNVGIGTTTPVQKLSVVGNAQFTAVTSGVYGFDLNLTSDGTLTTAASDERLKKNIASLDASSTLEKLIGLRPVEFDWKSNSTHDIGLIAQEVEQIFPELVFTNPTDGYKGVNYSRIPVLLIGAVQELGKKVELMFAWFGENRFNIQGEICVDDVCVTKEQFKQMLINGGGNKQNTDVSSQGNTSTTNQEENTSDNNSENSTSTPEISTETSSNSVENEGGTDTSQGVIENIPEVLDSIDLPSEPVVESASTVDSSGSSNSNTQESAPSL